jgi:hypothetical protein
MQTKTEATVEDLYNAPDDGKYELVNGKLVKMQGLCVLDVRYRER